MKYCTMYEILYHVLMLIVMISDLKNCRRREILKDPERLSKGVYSPLIFVNT